MRQRTCGANRAQVGCSGWGEASGGSAGNLVGATTMLEAWLERRISRDAASGLEFNWASAFILPMEVNS